MVTSALVETDIDTGKRLLSWLDERKFDVPSALWRYFPDAEEWRLVLATPLVDSLGRREAYIRLGKLLRDGPVAFSLSSIALISPDDELIELLFAAVGPLTSGTVRLTGNAIQGRYIEDVLIYRLLVPGKTT